MTIFIPTKFGVVKMDLEDRLKFPGKIRSYDGGRKINIMIYHKGKDHHGHRLVLGTTRRDLVVDHKNGNRFDWRKKNLRAVKQTTNMKNKGHYRKTNGLPRGVRPNGNKFIASITYESQTYHIGSYDSPELASEAFIARHKKLHGKNSVYNIRTDV